MRERNWERKATNIAGVFLFRLPASKGRPAALGSSMVFLKWIVMLNEE